MEKKSKATAANAAKKSSGINPGIVIPILAVVSYLIFKFILGSPSNFKDPEKLHDPLNFMGIIYSGGIIVPFLITFMLVVLVFSIERFITLGKASGSGDLDAFVRKVRANLDSNNIADAMKECEKQKGTVGRSRRCRQ